MRVDPDTGLHLVESLPSCGTRIHKQHVAERSDPLNLQDMTVAAYEYVGRLFSKLISHSTLPTSRVAGNMGHHDGEPIDLELLMFRSLRADVPSIHIAIHRPDRSQCFQCYQHIHRSNVSSMQDQIDIGQIVRQVRVKPAVGVGKNTEYHRIMNRTPTRALFRGHSPSDGAHCETGMLK